MNTSRGRCTSTPATNTSLFWPARKWMRTVAWDTGMLIINPPGTSHGILSECGCIVLASTRRR